MMLSGRPLLDNRADTDLFVDREEELLQLSWAVEHSYNALLTGDAGMGRTSLLRTLMYRTRNGGAGAPVGDFAIRYMRAEALTEPEQLLTLVAEGVLGDGESYDSPRENLDALREAATREREETFARWRNAGDDVEGARFSSVLIVDDVSGAAGHGMFGRLRDELWELGYVWLVSARSSEQGTLLLPPADAFFERKVHLGPLSGSDAEKMITARTGSHSGSWPAQVAHAVGGNPRRILTVARDMIDKGGAFEPILEAIARRDAAIHALGRPESMLAAELDALGAAAASDEALLKRLGWTRARAVQVLGNLENAGLVVAVDVRSAGQGRPRRVFRLTPPATYVEALRQAQG